MTPAIRRRKCGRPSSRSACRPPWMPIKWAGYWHFASMTPCPRATRPSWSCSTLPGCAWPNWWDCISGPWIWPTAPCACSARATRRGSCPSGRYALAALKQWLKERAGLIKARRASAVRGAERPAAVGAGRAVAGGLLGPPSWGWARICTRTCSATPSPRTCSNPAAICAECRNCWAMPISAPPRSTPTWIFSTWPSVYEAAHPRARRQRGA